MKRFITAAGGMNIVKKRELGKGGLEVSALGLGCMSMTSAYGPASDKSEMIQSIRSAHDDGVTDLRKRPLRVDPSTLLHG
jgi:hypothetical protein